MDEYEWRRAEPMLWAMFAAACAQRNSPSLAASKADELMKAFTERYPVRERESVD